MIARLLARLLIGATLVSSLASLPALAAEPQAGGPGSDPVPDTQTALQLIDGKRYEDAIVSCRRALGRDERYTPAMVAMAKAYYYLKKYELSTSVLEIAQKINPNLPEALEILGYIALTRDDRIGATAAFKKAVELKPDFGNAWNNLAGMYLYAKNYDAALEAAEKATSYLPRFDKAWLNLGSAYRGKTQYADAERAYRKALEFNAQFAAVYFNLGILYLDAPQMPGMDTTARLNQALAHFARYKDFVTLQPPQAPPGPAQPDPVDSYIEEAKKALVLEQKRLDREKKKKERGQPKAPDAPGEAGQNPGGNP